MEQFIQFIAQDTIAYTVAGVIAAIAIFLWGAFTAYAVKSKNKIDDKIVELIDPLVKEEKIKETVGKTLNKKKK